jgi:hypothetical protein
MKKIFKDPIEIHFKFESQWLERLKTLARKRSVELDQNVTYNDLIRAAIVKEYPSLIEKA